ncbi:hypothetical protein Ahy_B03g064068 isoform C [Arachis hypogaea]|uniref:Uncharacterized protein n=1 Tax=Arachis hypogaea TaxID=3818 RepID=A0A444ZYM5_ARAHY|nr:hypothetical protein Ahy_B03g064068 isoform C [Arachis hypogaea]
MSLQQTRVERKKAPYQAKNITVEFVVFIYVVVVNTEEEVMEKSSFIIWYPDDKDTEVAGSTATGGGAPTSVLREHKRGVESDFTFFELCN